VTFPPRIFIRSRWKKSTNKDFQNRRFRINMQLVFLSWLHLSDFLSFTTGFFLSIKLISFRKLTSLIWATFSASIEFLEPCNIFVFKKIDLIIKNFSNLLLCGQHYFWFENFIIFWDISSSVYALRHVTQYKSSYGLKMRLKRGKDFVWDGGSWMNLIVLQQRVPCK
jgi:hypothetical protein